MLIFEYKVAGKKQQYAAIEEAIRIVQFIRNKCLRLWMDEHATKNDLQCSCATLAKAYPFAARLNSQARQASADRAWFAIARFYDNCKAKKPGKKGYPRFVRHEVAFTTVATGSPGRNPIFCNWFPIGTCVTGNSGVWSFRDKEILASAVGKV